VSDDKRNLIIGVIGSIIATGILALIRKARDGDLDGFFRALWQGPLIALTASLVLNGVWELLHDHRVMVNVFGWTVLLVIPAWIYLARRDAY